MRWSAFFILAYVTLAIQVGLGSFIEFHGAWPNLMLIVAIFVAINTPRQVALIAALLLGLFQDFFGLYPLGLHAFTFGVMALVILSLQQVFHRDHPITHFSMALVGSLVEMILMQFWHRVYPWLHYSYSPMHPGILTGMLASIYTALVAVGFLPLLQRMKRVFAFERRTRMEG